MTPTRTRVRTRKRRVHAVSIAVEELAGHWLVLAEPTQRGIYGHRARMPKCTCPLPAGVQARAGRCRYCKGWDIYGVAEYVRQLLRAYPKVTVTERVEVAA